MDLSPDEDNFPERLLHQAALWDNAELLQELLLSGYEIDAPDACGRTALHAAALGERSRCLAVLCAAGADVNARSDDRTGGGKTALHIAAERGHVKNIETLLSAGAVLSTPDAGGCSALMLAERSSHLHAIRLLTLAADALERQRLQHHAELRDAVGRGDIQAVKAKLLALTDDVELVVNLAPGGANTLLYVAAEAGLTEVVLALLCGGADGRAHPVTSYSPLYAACYHGHADIARTLLAQLPRAAQQETVEKWLPIHAACIGGHPALVSLLLDYPYPDEALSGYTDPTGQWQYRFAFDVNARDVSGQTPLYVACTLGNLTIVDILLKHSVAAAKISSNENGGETRSPSPKKQEVLSPNRSGISLGIHAIVSKLTGQSNSKNETTDVEPRVHPVNVEAGRPGDSCLGAAVRGGHAKVVQRLLAAGADADAPCKPPDKLSEFDHESRRRRSSSALAGRSSTSPSPCRAAYGEREGTWTPLALAARAKNAQLLQLLLSHGATDAHCLALRECARNGLEAMLATLLATKAYPDPDYKINKNGVAETVFSGRDGDSSTLTYNALSPSTPVMISWRELHCQIAKIRMKWIREAALRINPKLGKAAVALHAVTRIDVSNNELRLLPPELFALVSLRYLNAAQNKLERLPLPTDPLEEEEELAQRTKRRPKKSFKFRREVYSAPVLEELYLQDNRLEELPAGMFTLPNLVTLDVSNNKLRALPSDIWSAPKLRDLNVALNHLRELPLREQIQSDSTAQSPTCSSAEPSPQISTSSSIGQMPQFIFTNTKSESRSPSVDRSIPEMQSEQSDEEGVPVLGNRAGNAVWSEARRPHTWRRALDSAVEPAPREPPAGSTLTSLNLSHNQFTCVPPSLACLAPRLTRLNMAYNSLRSMSYVTSYPTSLRQLDLSHNEITCWPSLPQVESVGSVEGDPLACYCLNPVSAGRSRPRSGGSVRSQLLHAACPARRHLRLEGLRTLILANNLLTRIQLTTDDDGYTSSGVIHDGGADDEEEWDSGPSVKARLLFPLLSMLDVSCNLLRAVPPAIHELSNLSVLNISGNKDITDLPPQMGLLSRLWNLNTSGCPLQEPLRSMIQCGKYKSMDIVGYLKSVLEEAQPYTRMKLMFVGLQGIGKTSLLECLRQESAAAHRRKQTDHWAKRMGNKSSRNRNMSTVGVDIGVWVYEKQRSSRGPLTFRTWDFGGQQEYYATHQYFLSRRSLYLVLWKVTEGKRALAGALRWLRSIQARAPGSPVIMVATHYDQVVNSNLPENESPEALQRFIRSSIMGAPDADKLGLPRVLDSVEVSCSTRHNIRLLADIIYSVAYSVKPPGSKEPLLEQRVPATYLALEECVTHLAAELKEPVLRHDEYKRMVTQYMQQKNHRMFRDAAELHQATMFLHENGVILHYDDATLKELYFLRPQWLCDMLAHVVTVREINPFAGSGIMKLDDLAHVFKASPLLGRGEEARGLCVSLLNKFELALAWDGRSLLVPPLLPARECNTQLPLRTRTWGSASRGTPRRAWIPSTLSSVPTEPCSAGTDSPKLVSDTSNGVSVTARNGARALRRLLLLSYVPCGFWPRLCARVLSDDAVAECAPPFYKPPPEIEADETTSKALDFNWAWKLWKTGLKLVCGELVLIVVREVMSRCDQLLGSSLPLGDDEEVMDEEGFGNLRFRLRQDGAWCDLEAQSSSCVEILLPAQVCVVRREDGMPMAGYQSISLEPNPEALARLLALISDHVDLLLEDWYPSLGTRFVHTSSGRCLITRVVPCPSCLREPMSSPAPAHDNGFMQAFRRLELNGVEAGARRVRLSQESRTSDGDSGVGAESNASSRLGSVEGALSVRTNGEESDALSIAYGWSVEECILAACSNGGLQCPTHGELRLADLAPDTLLLDVEENRRARWDSITRGRLLGRGAFGVVLRAEWRRAGHSEPVALKVLQPVPPGAHAGASARQAYKAAVSRWEREPAAAACRAYCGLRQELSVLTALRHQHVVPLRAVCASPLALLLTLAPMGALDSTLRVYRGCGARVGVRAARALALQVARALEYLHTKRIVYRDLKSENVLVWSMPKPQEAHAAEASPAAVNVHVKLGDYGISRLAPPSGTKGFGGTEGFMAPEIMRYNGEEEYNEKVDCFSYGMLLYEIMSLRQPFEGHEAVKEAVLDGCRPTLSPRELQYPCCMLELMRRCWSTAPEHRPCSSALVSLTAAPEFTALQDACGARTAICAHAVPISTVTDDGAGGWEVWCGGEGERIHTLLATPTGFTHQHSLKMPPDNGEPVQVTAVSRVGARVWIGDSAGRISVYSASTCAYTWGCSVQESVGGGPRAAVSALQPLPSLSRVAVALDSGRLFLVSSSRPAAEGSFVLSELGAASELKCLAAVPRPHGWEVWAGGGGLYAYAVSASGACGAEELRTQGRVAHLAAASDEPYVFTHSQPGCVVQQWSVRSREVTARLDCSKLVPCSESLQSIAIDEHHPDNCQVRALCAFRSQLYAGTAWGCVVVADAATLRPVTVFRPYENEVRSIIALPSHGGADGGCRLATLGHGYRPLLHRYAPAQQQSTSNAYSGTYCLLWRVDRWLPD